MMTQFFILSVSKTGYFLGTQEQELQVRRCSISVEMQSWPRCKKRCNLKAIHTGFCFGGLYMVSANHKPPKQNPAFMTSWYNLAGACLSYIVTSRGFFF